MSCEKYITPKLGAVNNRTPSLPLLQLGDSIQQPSFIKSFSFQLFIHMSGL